MLLSICDRCGKQIDRFVNPNPPPFQISIRHHGERACWTRPMNFCRECEEYLSDKIERELRSKPKSVTLNTSEDWEA